MIMKHRAGFIIRLDLGMPLCEGDMGHQLVGGYTGHHDIACRLAANAQRQRLFIQLAFTARIMHNKEAAQIISSHCIVSEVPCFPGTTDSCLRISR